MKLPDCFVVQPFKRTHEEELLLHDLGQALNHQVPELAIAYSPPNNIAILMLQDEAELGGGEALAEFRAYYYADNVIRFVWKELPGDAAPSFPINTTAANEYTCHEAEAVCALAMLGREISIRKTEYSHFWERNPIRFACAMDEPLPAFFISDVAVPYCWTDFGKYVETAQRNDPGRHPAMKLAGEIVPMAHRVFLRDGGIYLAAAPAYGPIEAERCCTPEKVLEWVSRLSDKVWFTATDAKQFIMLCESQVVGSGV